MNYPPAKAAPRPVTFGRVSYTDPFAWLEEESAESLAYQEQQDQLTQDWLASRPSRARATALMAAMPRVDADFPVFSGGRWFRKHTPAGKDLQVIEVADAIGGPWRLLADLNAIVKDEPLQFDNFAPSPDGRKLLYGWSRGGRELENLRVIEVDSGKVLLDAIRQIRPMFPAWFADSSGFYYSAMDPAAPTAGARAYRQVLGAEPVTRAEDYAPTHPLGWVRTASDKRHSLLIADHLNPRVDYIRDESLDAQQARSGTNGWRPFLKGEKHMFRGDVLGDRFIAVTDEGAPCGRLVSIPLGTPTDRSSWRELVPGSENVMGTMLIVDGAIVLADLVNCYSRLRVFEADGRLKGEIALPGRGAMSAGHYAMPNMLDMMWKGSDGDVFFAFSSPSQSPALYRANVRTLKLEALTRPVVQFDAQVRDFEAKSADGARVPYQVIARPDVDLSRPQPTIIYGYGGFNVALVPGWSGSPFAAWIQAGGVVVHAHLRGGGELGPQMWHQGRLTHKQNSFNDVYAVAEDLIARRITTASQLGVHGGSNGGVMAAVVAVQRPDLFRASHPNVPITDVLGRLRDPITMQATLDYGDPQDAQMSEVIFKWSPYQNVKDGIAYPALLLDSGRNDPRCPPWHVRKMAARLQPANRGANPILMRVRDGAGHGAVGTEAQRLAGAEFLTFFADQLGLAL